MLTVLSVSRIFTDTTSSVFLISNLDSLVCLYNFYRHLLVVCLSYIKFGQSCLSLEFLQTPPRLSFLYQIWTVLSVSGIFTNTSSSSVFLILHFDGVVCLYNFYRHHLVYLSYIKFGQSCLSLELSQTPPCRLSFYNYIKF